MREPKIPWWSRIKLRVLVFGVLMSVIPVALVSSYFLYFAKRDLQKSIQVQNRLLVERIAQQVDALLQQTEGTLKHVDFSLLGDQPNENGQIQLYHILKEIPMADEAVVLDPKGLVRQAVDRFEVVSRESLTWQDPEMISHLQAGKVYYSRVTFLDTGIPSVRIVVPYFSADGRTFLGGIGAKVRLRSLFALVGSKQAGSREDVFMVDAEGRLIAHNDFTRVLLKIDVSRSFSVQHFLHNGDPEKLPAPNRYSGYAGQEVLGVYSKVPRTGWGVLVEQPVAVAFASINALLARLFWFLLIIVSAAVFLSIIMGLYFTKPIEYLEGAIRKVGRGLLNTSISLQRRDELGHLAAVFNDMTAELRLKSEKLEQEKERLDAIVNGIGAGLALMHADHRITWMNPVLASWLGTDAGRNREATCYETLGNSNCPCNNCPLSLEGASPNTEDLFTSLSLNGDQKVFRHRVYQLEHVRPGDPPYLLVVENITEQHRMEELVMQADKLSALGLMASGFAHEINNPLATIQAYAEDLTDRLQTERRELVDSGDMDRYLRVIRDNVARSKQITQNLLNFSRKSEWKQEWIDVPAVLEESLALIHHSIVKKRVQIFREWEPNLPKVRGDALQLMQVIVNLLNNALDAVALAGFVGIQAYDAGDQLKIRVYDNGPGILREHLAKVFDPFFTTKEVGKGTGLGLSIAYGIISRMGGTISLESTPGQGTEVLVSLPVVEGYPSR